MDLKAMINTERLLEVMEEFINTPSVVGYYPQVHKKLEEFAQKHHYAVTYDNRHTAYIHVDGIYSDKTVCLGAHLDTIGMVVRSIEENGWLDVRNLGGVNFHSLEGENVYIHTRSGKTYTGMVICKSHSVHVFDDARSRERDFPEMAIVLDEDVTSKQDVEALGIMPGDLVSVEPRFIVTPSGYIKSRHIDDKANVAILLEILTILDEQQAAPFYDTVFAFPIYEEIGLGGRYVPDEISEYLALDIGLIGGLQNGSEKQVSIAGADRISPYDWDLTNELLDLSRKYDVNSAMDIYYRYGSDATAALEGGDNIAPASIGMGTMASHGYERTHIDGVFNTALLALAYVLDRTNED